jgi:predicted phosphoribosyltransferase
VVRAWGAGRVVLAAPVGPPGVAAELAPPADEVVCPLTPEGFGGVGRWYADFAPTPDAEVVRALEAGRRG